MKSKKTSLGKQLASLTESILKSEANKSFDIRRSFNEEKVWSISEGPFKNDFKSDLQVLRGSLNIPKLDFDSDWQIVSSPTGDAEMEESSWLHSKNDNFINEFENAITETLKKYQLPNNFRTWVEQWLLYRKRPKTFPIQYFEVPFNAAITPKWLDWVALTTKEKNFVRKIIPQMFGFKKKPPKRLTAMYRQIIENISRSKNKQRRMRAFDTAQKTLKKPKTITYHDYTLGAQGKNVTETYTFERLAQEVFPEEEVTGSYKEEVRKLETKAARLRKQKQRLLQRVSIRHPK